MQLRKYQSDIIQQLSKTWSDGHRSVICQMPTGTGKTVVLGEVVKLQLTKASPHEVNGILVIAHRAEILSQTRDTLDKLGLGEWIDTTISLYELMDEINIIHLTLLQLTRCKHTIEQ